MLYVFFLIVCIFSWRSRYTLFIIIRTYTTKTKNWKYEILKMEKLKTHNLKIRKIENGKSQNLKMEILKTEETWKSDLVYSKKRVQKTRYRFCPCGFTVTPASRFNIQSKYLYYYHIKSHIRAVYKGHKRK